MELKKQVLAKYLRNKLVSERRYQVRMLLMRQHEKTTERIIVENK